MSALLDFFRRNTQPQDSELPRLLPDYRVGIVVSNQGMNSRQLAEVAARLDFISKNVESDGRVYVYVPGFNLADPEESVSRDLRNMLERKRMVRITYIGTRGDHKAGVAEHIAHEMYANRCDEIWCCPSLGQTANSPARVAQVYRIGQARYPTRYKMIPPWVDPAVPSTPAKPKQPKGGPKWPRKNRSR